MARALALLAAVAMVVGALVWRERTGADDASAVADAGTAAADPAADPAEPLTLTCVPELRTVCQGLQGGDRPVQVTVEDPADTAEALAASTTEERRGPQVWLVPAPWVEVATAMRSTTAGDPGEPALTAPVARSPLVLVGWEDRLAALDAACGQPVDWACLGEQAGRSWDAELGLGGAAGTVRPAHQGPATGATGLLVLGAAVADQLGTPDPGSQQLDQGGFASWFARLEGAVPSLAVASPSLVGDLLTRGRAAYDVAGVTEAEAVTALERVGAGRELPAVRYPEPLATADLVLAAYPGSGGAERVEAELGDGLRARLREAGWRVADGEAPAATPLGAPAVLPADDGVPGGGFLAALRTRYEEVVR